MRAFVLACVCCVRGCVRECVVQAAVTNHCPTHRRLYIYTLKSQRNKFYPHSATQNARRSNISQPGPRFVTAVACLPVLLIVMLYAPRR